MKGQRSTEERIAFAPNQADAGTPVEEICRQRVYFVAALRAVNLGHAIEWGKFIIEKTRIVAGSGHRSEL